MINDDVDTDPDNPDGIFLPSDRRKFDHTNPWDVLEHDRALAAFEKRKQEYVRTKLNKEEKTWYGLREEHVMECTCSYCGSNGYAKGLKLGLNIPPDWLAFNAWWVWCTTPDYCTRIYHRFTPFSFLRGTQLWWRRVKRAL